MKLASEAALAAVARDVASSDCLTEYRAEMLEHPIAGWCLRNYVILTEFPELLGDCDLSASEIFWNRYYWFARFTHVWTAVVGYDAGLEQQLFQFLEHSPHSLDDCPKIEAAAEQAAVHQLRAAGIG